MEEAIGSEKGDLQSMASNGVNKVSVTRHRSPTANGETKDAILDSTEVLLADGDPATVTMRAIAESAGVDPASITYHFGGRAELLAAVIRRRYTILRTHRMRALTRLLAESEEIPTARQVLDTVYRPWFELITSGDVGWRCYAKLVAAMPDSPVLQELTRDLSGDWESALNSALLRSLPGADSAVITQAFTLTLGASLLVAVPPPMVLVGREEIGPDHVAPSYPDFLHFISSGFEGMVSRSTV